VQDQASLVREQQARAMHIENTGMVVVSDLVSDTNDIHPKDKHDVGLRLANWALADTYHRSGIDFKSPAYQSMEVKGDKIIITCANASGGLIMKDKMVSALVIAGEDKVFWPASARVEGDKLIVWSKEVKKPVAVRYQFSNAGIGNIAGKDGLPLAPFRTDDWQIGSF
jgi:sialate O-acetylesterase